MYLADRLADAAERGDNELLAELLDIIDWLDNTRQVAGASAQMN